MKSCFYIAPQLIGHSQSVYNGYIPHCIRRLFSFKTKEHTGSYTLLQMITSQTRIDNDMTMIK